MRYAADLFRLGHMSGVASGIDKSKGDVPEKVDPKDLRAAADKAKSGDAVAEKKGMSFDPQSMYTSYQKYQPYVTYARDHWPFSTNKSLEQVQKDASKTTGKAAPKLGKSPAATPQKDVKKPSKDASASKPDKGAAKDTASKASSSSWRPWRSQKDEEPSRPDEKASNASQAVKTEESAPSEKIYTPVTSGESEKAADAQTPGEEIAQYAREDGTVFSQAPEETDTQVTEEASTHSDTTETVQEIKPEAKGKEKKDEGEAEENQDEAEEKKNEAEEKKDEAKEPRPGYIQSGLSRIGVMGMGQ